jgi:hypothetical protein
MLSKLSSGHERYAHIAALRCDSTGQHQLSLVDVGAGAEVHEYSVLATSLGEELVSFGQL